ncbi:hypothetical protein RO1_17830 [Roseburia intestinalis XB6B4]|uniref:Uncharacterized protein n=1 Tax=Roseburia intestinalis XB6B4 TaxID=718255 RepID=D4KYA8_9FIRM|nr:hypothetical protein RO1_17830 [Roseburia intestinalis XB6B4]
MRAEKDPHVFLPDDLQSAFLKSKGVFHPMPDLTSVQLQAAECVHVH